MAKTKIEIFINNFDLKKYLDSNKIKYKETSSDPIQYILYECPFCKNINYKGNIHPNRFYISSENKQFVCFIYEKEELTKEKAKSLDDES